MERELPTVYSSLILPSAESIPSPSSLQWSKDGQLFFVAKSAIFILTPVHIGISSDIRKSFHVVDSFGEKSSRLQWAQTKINLDKYMRQRQASCNNGSRPDPRSSDVKIAAIACSPSNLMENGGCVVAVLTSSADVVFWAPSNDSIRSDWIQVHELRSDSSGLSLETAPPGLVSCIAWSPQADFGVTPSPGLDGSIFITATQGGLLTFLRFKRQGISVVLGSLTVTDKCITHLSCSPWITISPGEECESFLAYGTSDGAVGFLDLHQTLNTAASHSIFGPDLCVGFHLGTAYPVFPASPCGLTALEWVVSPDTTILVRCIPGKVDLWSQTESNVSWTGFRSLELRKPADLAGVRANQGTNTTPALCGLQYIAHEDALVISATDGSVQVVLNVSYDPSLEIHPRAQPNAYLTTAELSSIGRSILNSTHDPSEKDMEADAALATPSAVTIISGITTYDNYGTLLLVKQRKSRRALSTVLIAAELWGSSEDDRSSLCLAELSSALHSAKSADGTTPQHILRPLFMTLQLYPELHVPVLKALLPQSISYASPVFSAWPGDPAPTSVLRAAFRQSLSVHLLGVDSLLELKMMLYIAETLENISPSHNARDLAETIALQLSNAISQILLRVLLRHLSALIHVLNVDDAPFILRIIQCSSPEDTPADLREEAQSLLDALCDRFPSIGADEVAEAMQDACPACKDVIEYDGSRYPQCSRGHSWERCSITSLLVSSAGIRSCLGCKRKAFLPPTAGNKIPLPRRARTWLVEDLLRSIGRCLYCGNNFLFAGT